MLIKFRSNEQANFSKLLRAHLDEPDAPLLLEGSTGLGKTRAYLYPILAAARDGKRIAIVLPTRQLIEQLLDSTDIKVCNEESKVEIRAFIPKRYFKTAEEYASDRKNVLAAPVMLCTSASVIIDQRLGRRYNGATQRDYLLFDEADQLPDVAALQSDITIDQRTLKDLKIKFETAQQATEELLDNKHVAPEDRARAKIILEALAEPFWFITVGLDDEGSIVLYHKMPGRLLKQIANKKNTAFISATLTVANKFDDFMRAMGISAISRYSSAVEPRQHGSLTFSIHHSDEVNSPEWVDTVLNAIDESAKPCLVVTSSYAIANEFFERCPNAVTRNEEISETATQASLRLMNDDSKDTLIATAAWAGLDTPVIWKSIIVPKIPFSKPTIIDGKIESHYISSRNAAIRRMRQVIGRGLRSPDADCNVIICDARWDKIETFVPDRFRQSWMQKSFDEGAQIDVALSTNERSHYLRNLAIKHYGLKCYACDFSPKTVNQIDIHHLDPIAEGERKTTLNDVIPLCANCHRLAHSERPPLALEEIKALVQEVV
ncbi:MAG: DEAD/DEAH box helicase [Burkholderiales bacterium]|nr:DEAD/DEAH box helicase [Burkholderiales bacterium]